MVQHEHDLPVQPPWSIEHEGTVTKPSLNYVMQRLTRNLERDRLVQDTLIAVRQQLAVDRLVLYYFFEQWQGQVTSEALATPSLSILGSTGGDNCFNKEYAELYLAGRTRAIADIPQSNLDPCHKEFLASLYVKANLAVPILTHQQLWGLLIAHHCQCARPWLEADVTLLQNTAQKLATAPAIQDQI